MTVSAKGTALITGASSGIGAVYADRLSRRGYNLILVARNREKLNTVAKKIGDKTGRAVEVEVADLGHKADLRRVEDLLRSDASISMLVINGGVVGGAPLLDSIADKLEEMITLYVTALTRLI